MRNIRSIPLSWGMCSAGPDKPIPLGAQLRGETPLRIQVAGVDAAHTVTDAADLLDLRIGRAAGGDAARCGPVDPGSTLRTQRL
ncbi:hypothetical protein GCM10023147_08440 [Tsukamurella soli]|uniref:Uncharacterized protein n=1 Tax=Tsukamurella soli TaxID=644556 RepID=A0ABP8J6H8_9ACTN